MVSKGDDIWVVYPLYFDISVSRKDGRRVPRSLALDNPRCEEIKASLDSLDISCAIEDKEHPSIWNKKQKRVLVRKTVNKAALLQLLAEKMKEGRIKS